MKTPDDFATVINQRKADPVRTLKRRKPPVIIVTLIFAVFALMVGVIGFVHVTRLLAGALHGWRSILVWAAVLAPELALMGFAAATLFACLRRPQWGRLISMVFAVAFSASMGYGLVHPDPHPVFQIAPGAEQAGAYTAHVMIALGMVVYLWSMLAGAKAKAYFARDPVGN